MSKERRRGNRELKKPKAPKKPVAPTRLSFVDTAARQPPTKPPSK
jgi:hypothetical protein